MSAIGTLIAGRYRLDSEIGRGGMSSVYRAFDAVLERTVAIKVMHREIATDSDQLERFRREARAVAQLNHPHVVAVIDAGEESSSDGAHPDAGTPYIVLEYVDGETLKAMIRREGPLEIPQALAYAIEIARALGAAHERQIVHRDVKPQNILVSAEGGAKITDFGIARSLTEEGLTAAGRVLGTTDYVSPEQALGQPVTGQSDLYSLGVVLYEMLTGEVPFRGESPVAVAMKHVREELPDVQRTPAADLGGDGRRGRPRHGQGPRRALPGRGGHGRRPRGGARGGGGPLGAGDGRGHDGAAHAARAHATTAALADAPPRALAAAARGHSRDRRRRPVAGGRRDAPRHGRARRLRSQRTAAGAAQRDRRQQLQPLRHRPRKPRPGAEPRRQRPEHDLEHRAVLRRDAAKGRRDGLGRVSRRGPARAGAGGRTPHSDARLRRAGLRRGPHRRSCPTAAPCRWPRAAGTDPSGASPHVHGRDRIPIAVASRLPLLPAVADLAAARTRSRRRSRRITLLR